MTKLPQAIIQEREVHRFAAEFLTPMDSISAELPTRVDFTALIGIQRTWGYRPSPYFTDPGRSAISLIRPSVAATSG